ncbi:MAG: XdhC family protein [Nocardioidaceae bacterium]
MARSSSSLSDGWERGDPLLLGEQVRTAAAGSPAASCGSNPHRGKVGYAPVQGGIAAALPYLDALVAGHSMATLRRALGGGRRCVTCCRTSMAGGRPARPSGVATVVAHLQVRAAPARRVDGWSRPAARPSGSVSGGCVEGAVYELSQQVVAGDSPMLQRYGVSDDDAFAVGLTCGGILDVFVEPVVARALPRACGRRR